MDFFCFDPGPSAEDDFSTFSDGFLKMYNLFVHYAQVNTVICVSDVVDKYTFHPSQHQMQSLSSHHLVNGEYTRHSSFSSNLPGGPRKVQSITIGCLQ